MWYTQIINIFQEEKVWRFKICPRTEEWGKTDRYLVEYVIIAILWFCVIKICNSVLVDIVAVWALETSCISITFLRAQEDWGTGLLGQSLRWHLSWSYL